MESMLGHLYGAVIDPGRFEAFVGEVQASLRSHLVAIQTDDGSHAHSVRQHFGNVQAPPPQDSADDVRINQFIARGADTLLEDGVLDCARFFKPGELESTAFYKQVLVPMDVHHSVGVLLASEGREFIGLSASRNRHARPFDAADIDLLRRLQPHLAMAHALNAKVVLGQTVADAIASTSTAVLYLGADARVLHANPAAAEMLAAGQTGLRLRGKFLTSDNDADRTRLEAAMGAATDVRAQPFTWQVHDRFNRPCAVAGVRRIDPGHSRPGLFWRVPHAVMWLRPMKASPDGLAERLKSTFGLTPAEAMLASALLEHGSLARCGKALGKSHETLRTQLKSLFAKTDTSAQADLVQRLRIACEI